MRQFKDNRSHKEKFMTSTAARLNPSSDDKPAKIVLIDDDRMFGRILEKVAERRSIPLVACHPDDDPALLTKLDISLLLIDYDLGKLDGVALLKPLQMKMKPVPVIFISNSLRPNLMFQAVPSNVLGFVMKSEFHEQFLSSALALWQSRKKNR
jgi:DNA-binding NarL/FixJ family response regulator